MNERTFRVFVSSTFADLKAERNALQEHVFPKLQKLCEANGCGKTSWFRQVFTEASPKYNALITGGR